MRGDDTARCCAGLSAARRSEYSAIARLLPLRAAACLQSALRVMRRRAVDAYRRCVIVDAYWYYAGAFVTRYCCARYAAAPSAKIIIVAREDIAARY